MLLLGWDIQQWCKECLHARSEPKQTDQGTTDATANSQQTNHGKRSPLIHYNELQFFTYHDGSFAIRFPEAIATPKEDDGPKISKELPRTEVTAFIRS